LVKQLLSSGDLNPKELEELKRLINGKGE
jgi:hypothetical protein